MPWRERSKLHRKLRKKRLRKRETNPRSRIRLTVKKYNHKGHKGTQRKRVTEFKLPELGENVDQGDLVRLMISPGVSIVEGQPVMELETEKAVVEVPSSVSGKVKDVRVKEGETVKVGQVIFTVENGAGRAGVSAKPPAALEPPKAPTPSAPPPQATPAPSSAASGPAEFRLPELGENISQADLVRLMISPGSRVSEGQPVMELETEKAVVEVPSSVSGIVKEIPVKQGD